MITDPSQTVVSDGQIKSRPPRGLISLALGFLIADFFLLHLPDLVPGLRIPGTHWNWSGNAISIAFSCVVLVCSPWLRQNVGLRWRQSSGSVRMSLICFLACLGTGITLDFYNSPMAFSRETLLFQIFIPGIGEELAVRGIALALLEKAFGQSPVSCRLRYGWAAFMTSLLFGVAHAGGGISFFLLVPFCFASLAALVRMRSGSLLWPMLCHSALDGSLFLFRMIR
jgi:membrane protease YdiL (CAAX protease family)